MHIMIRCHFPKDSSKLFKNITIVLSPLRQSKHWDRYSEIHIVSNTYVKILTSISPSIRMKTFHILPFN